MSRSLLFIIFLIFFIVLIVLFLFWDKINIFTSKDKVLDQPIFPRKIVKINDIELEVELANTPYRRRKGLSGREGLLENSGMLFEFPKSGFHAFWMINMKFPLDIIWIDEYLKITGVEKNISPKSFPKTFRPHWPTKYILEVNAGWTDKYFIKPGDVFSFEN